MTRRPGRPRNEGIDSQVLRATLAIIDAEDEVTVAKVVTASGVSRAAIYRRWPSLTALLAAALDVGRRVPAEVPPEDLREAFLGAMLGGVESPLFTGYSDAQFRQRIRLVMADRALQKEYWEAHVTRRRAPLEAALERAKASGLLRADLDVPASFDALAGIAYYQVVVRGLPLGDPASRHRVQAAFDTVWRGMLANP